MKVRELAQVTRGFVASDGDGVRLTRFIGGPDLPGVDPFLLLDCFGSERPGDYIGGFPDHPHRGFETVTYMLAGRMRHRDSRGHEDVIGPGDLQWMTAGRGLVHSEMPEQSEGLMKGFQLWVNLPAADKMCEPAYRSVRQSELPVERLGSGGLIKVMAGLTDGGTEGALCDRRQPARWRARDGATKRVPRRSRAWRPGDAQIGRFGGSFFAGGRARIA
jgi:redox-sensitive bicupin YhaK (pirin superfamily)